MQKILLSVDKLSTWVGQFFSWLIVALTLSITYPASVSQTTQAVRDRVRERVAALAGLPVARIDIDIPLLSAGAGP